MDVLEIQQTLFKFGFNPGEIDGVWGRRTSAAVKAFQRAHGLMPDGIVGPLTARALSGAGGITAVGVADAADAPLVWYEEAINLLGTNEVEGRGSNRKILKWAQDLNIDYSSDDVPWCGLFTAHCIGAALPDEELPTRPLAARSWRRFGEACQPMRGAVLVFWRERRDGPLGHVGFYHSEDEAAFHVLGGNQSNSVSVARVGKKRLLASRWPISAKILTGAVVTAEAKGPLSHSEG